MFALISVSVVALIAYVWTRNPNKSEEHPAVSQPSPGPTSTTSPVPTPTHVAAKTSCPTVEERGVPKNSLYTLVLVPPAGEACAAAPAFVVGKQTLQDFGTIGHPVRGWVGCDGQEPLQGVRVESYSGDGKQRLAFTKTNETGKFAFPDLKEGQYQLVITGRGIARNRIIVTSSRKSDAAACVFAVAQQDAEQDSR
jgi:hypothetical protein